MERRVLHTVAILIQRHFHPTYYLRIEDFESIRQTAFNHSSIQNFVNNKSDEETVNHFILYVLTRYQNLQIAHNRFHAASHLVKLEFETEKDEIQPEKAKKFGKTSQHLSKLQRLDESIRLIHSLEHQIGRIAFNIRSTAFQFSKMDTPEERERAEKNVIRLHTHMFVEFEKFEKRNVLLTYQERNYLITDILISAEKEGVQLNNFIKAKARAYLRTKFANQQKRLRLDLLTPPEEQFHFERYDKPREEWSRVQKIGEEVERRADIIVEQVEKIRKLNKKINGNCKCQKSFQNS